MKNGGPAFPVECTWENGEPTQGVQTNNKQGWATGMSLRDYFAAKAMQGILAACLEEPDLSAETLDAGLAKNAYAIADAMLKVRDAEPQSETRK